MAEWLKAADCKFVEIVFYVGSNPTFSNKEIKKMFYYLSNLILEYLYN